MKLLVLFALIAIFVGGSESVVLDCKFIDYAWGYYCELKNAELITSKDDREITGIRGEHLSGRTDDNVVGFNAYGKKVDFFPRGLTKFFKKIKYIGIKNNLQEITKDDLKEFRHQLNYLDLGHNQIKHIEDGTFSGLENLNSLYLKPNPCTSDDDYAQNDRTKVLELIRKVEKSCKDPNYIPATSTTSNPATESSEANKNVSLRTLGFIMFVFIPIVA